MVHRTVDPDRKTVSRPSDQSGKPLRMKWEIFVKNIFMLRKKSSVFNLSRLWLVNSWKLLINLPLSLVLPLVQTTMSGNISDFLQYITVIFRILSTIDRELLKPSSSVALHKHSNALVDVLPPEADSSITMLSADEKPDISYRYIKTYWITYPG